eukprot:CAMPEP_0194664602 /NCGR_PEP_ID=MMETSP0295-20121207/1570_1 /TAXON_ID=39354 /ORGANISM="Heterosigma akashiwo, Strain CCMP2393" /LENGTH=149 /DNA_ID=CAMNT_0039546397 /DNA_START=568 /DNA_END=1017 /DNA_ORIENTATION=+
MLGRPTALSSLPRLEEPRDEDVGHTLAVALPVGPILGRTAFHIAGDAVCEHDQEEAEVEVRDPGVEVRDQAPGERHHEIGSVVNLPRDAPPATSEQQVPMFGLDVGRVLQDAPGQLGEGVPLDEGSLLGHAELVLLAVGRVPNEVAADK